MRDENTKFADDIRRNLSFLLEREGAPIIPNSQLSRAASVIRFRSATISPGDLILRFVHDCGEITVIAPNRAPNDSQELSAALRVMGVSG